ncbi:TetR family transcriptional regulator [Nocardia sp. NBC_00565]|uniref:TetR/AcrR family transcriptional regulator n=1 Tax=Nocardia sp. NBC_00565 TaxID=2975993 RepID=UPI002E80ABB4|nr:TetR family transcriptional regulator [Nocardia sp. NBC_00565]WUC01532.1 TetR family transcriptional regulator [Nocardia sp. NBC_00565]
MSTTDRRTALADAAIDLIATRGIRALTHRALDTALDLPAGSASYYFRTKRALIEAITDRITTRSRDDFTAAQLTLSIPTDPYGIAHAIASWLDRLLAERRNHLIVRHALIIELIGDPELHHRLTHSLFSIERARDLFRALNFPDPDVAAADFIAVVEGAVFDRFAGARTHVPAGTPGSVDQLATLLSRYLAQPRSL